MSLKSLKLSLIVIYLPLMNSFVVLIVPLPLMPPKLYFPEGFLPQLDSKASCAANGLAKAGSNPLAFKACS